MKIQRKMLKVLIVISDTGFVILIFCYILLHEHILLLVVSYFTGKSTDSWDNMLSA
jgi:hypothetical protein